MTHLASANFPGNPAGHWPLPRLLWWCWWPLAQVGRSWTAGAVCYVQWRNGDVRETGHWLGRSGAQRAPKRGREERENWPKAGCSLGFQEFPSKQWGDPRSPSCQPFPSLSLLVCNVGVTVTPGARDYCELHAVTKGDHYPWRGISPPIFPASQVRRRKRKWMCHDGICGLVGCLAEVGCSPDRTSLPAGVNDRGGAIQRPQRGQPAPPLPRWHRHCEASVWRLVPHWVS